MNGFRIKLVLSNDFGKQLHITCRTSVLVCVSHAGMIK